MCVTGPSNAILCSSGEREHQYIGGITYGVLAIAFGIFSSLMTWLALTLPQAYVAVLGGLAVLKVLENAFVAAFCDRYSAAALVTLLVTVSGVSLFNIGSPFWGIVIGVVMSLFVKETQPVAK